VASIDTVWAGTVAPSSRRVSSWRYDPEPPARLEHGAEMGRFNMGSTVILVFPPGRVEWDESLKPGGKLRMGERIGRFVAPGSQPTNL